MLASLPVKSLREHGDMVKEWAGHESSAKPEQIRRVRTECRLYVSGHVAYCIHLLTVCCTVNLHSCNEAGAYAILIKLYLFQEFQMYTIHGRYVMYMYLPINRM